MTSRDANSEIDVQLRAAMSEYPVPLRSVADVARISTHRSTDLIALIKEVRGNVRESKSNQDIIDVVLAGNTQTKPGMLAFRT